MECLSPILSNTTVHGRIWLPCSKCVACKQRNGREWFIRLKKHYEAQTAPSYFITLTYSELDLPYDTETGEATFDKTHVQKFIMQLRNFIKQGLPSWMEIKNYKEVLPARAPAGISYFSIAERGDLGNRPHYHIMAFNIPWDHDTFDQICKNLWKYGHTHVGKCEDKSICYITDYMVTKDDEKTEFRLMSKGIGEQYVEKHRKTLREKMQFKVSVHDKEFNMPRYFRKKVFTDPERKVIGKRITDELFAKQNPETYHTELQDRINDLHNKIAFKKEKRKAQRWAKIQGQEKKRELEILNIIQNEQTIQKCKGRKAKAKCL